MSPVAIRRFVTAFVITVAACAVFAQTAEQNATDAAWLVQALDIGAGNTVPINSVLGVIAASTASASP